MAIAFMEGFCTITHVDWERKESDMEIKKIDWGDLMKVAPVVESAIPATPKQEPVLTIETLAKAAANAASATSPDGFCQAIEQSLRDAGWSAEPEKPKALPVVGLDIETAPSNDEVAEALKAGATIKW